ncbi:MAG: response regulator [Acetatifactor sp.]|nr:response regulator [Acetatifactor sp.]
MAQKEKKDAKNKKQTIFRIFLIPLVGVMLAQSLIVLGVLVVRRTSAMLEDYSVSMMLRTVENRKVILRNDMVRWAFVSRQEAGMNLLVEEFLQEKQMTLDQVLSSKDMQNELLEKMLPDCMDILENSMTTGVFVVLTGEDAEGKNVEDAGEFNGFFLRDSSPLTDPSNYSDLMMERGSKQLSRTYGVPLDIYWTTAFSMSGQGKRAEENFFYEPWRAARENGHADSADLGYWSAPFVLETSNRDSHEMITYSVPLRYQGRVYAVMGVEVAVSYLYDYLPVSELDENELAGYGLAMRNADGSYTMMTGRGVLYNAVHDSADSLTVKDTAFENLVQVENTKLGAQHIFAATFPLELYGVHPPYQDTEWVLVGFGSEDALFSMSRTLYLWTLIALFFGLVFSLIGLYFVVRKITSPIMRLMACISKGEAGLQEFSPSNILEVDSLHDVVTELTAAQKAAEEALREEKELYRLALATTMDTFFSYDFNEKAIDIINNPVLNGRFSYEEHELGPIDMEAVYEEDRELLQDLLKQMPDIWNLELRMKIPGTSDYRWYFLNGNVLRDTKGSRWKLVGSVHDIQEQKEQEAARQRKVTTDGVTGFFAYAAGMQRLRELRKTEPAGVMIYLMMDNLRRMNEQNGITFGDMILEEFGRIVRDVVDHGSMQIRFDGNEFCVWLPGGTEQKAKEFVEILFTRVRERFPSDLFEILLHAGIALGDGRNHTREIARMAKRAQMAASKSVEEMGYACHSELTPKQELPGPTWRGKQVLTVAYGDNVSLVSLALTLFGKGENLAAQMYLMFQKLAQYYDASDVLLNMVQPEYRTMYLEYQWHRDTAAQITDHAMPYREEEWKLFVRQIENKRVLTWRGEEAQDSLTVFFCHGEGSACGYALPLYDNGNIIGILSILNGQAPETDPAEAVKNLLELGSVIQSQITQRRHDMASRAKSDFLSRMSHEIRTPMNGIIGMTAIAMQQNQSPERIQDCLQKIQFSSGYLLGLINDILDMSKIESGKLYLEPTDFSMTELLEPIEEMIRPQAQAKSIVFVKDIQLLHDCFVADKLRISQVLINLLGNAVKFTQEHGEVRLVVREETAEDGQAAIYFAVQDNGRGISPEDQERVFKAFEQVKGSNTSSLKGTGLGLSISSRLVQMMGSAIKLDSRLGEGSTFYFTVSVPVGQKVQEAAQEKEQLSFEGRRILVVEDNELNSEIARTILEEYRFHVDCVGDGAQAVKCIAETEPGFYDLVLMDIMMPVMDGLEATRAIRAMEREDCRTLPIIAMSANAFDDDLKKSVECGMNGHLSKPVEMDKLYKMLEDVLGKASD